MLADFNENKQRQNTPIDTLADMDESARVRLVARNCLVARHKLKFIKRFYNKRIADLQNEFMRELEAVKRELLALEDDAQQKAFYIENLKNRSE